MPTQTDTHIKKIYFVFDQLLLQNAWKFSYGIQTLQTSKPYNRGWSDPES